jgi:hypothetical protein
MSFERARKIADAVLLEGYVLYPYRSCSTKNQYRWTFGVLAPRAWSEAGGSDPWWLEAQVLVTGSAPRLSGRLRFLRVVDRRVEARDGDVFVPTERLEVGGAIWSSWEEGETTELDFAVPDDGSLSISLPASEAVELLRDGAGSVVGRMIRVRAALEGMIRIDVATSGEVTRVGIRVENLTHYGDRDAPRRQVMKAAFASTHLLLESKDGAFVSSIDPPAELRAEVASCQNVGTFPVLAGEEGEHHLVLCSPIVLGDHPKVAPESAGDFFDSCEIDEILALRTRALTADEKALVRATDPRAAELVDRVDGFDVEVMTELHGTIRDRRPVPETTAGGWATNPKFEPGTRVRILPNGARRTDAQDILYAGAIARVESVIEDVDGTVYLALTIEDDPAAELHRWYGRFHYYRTDEVEVVE